jgi:hypothetical protein
MIKTTAEDIISYLQENKYNAELQKDTGQVSVILSISGREFPLFLRPLEGSELLQLLVFIPTKIKSGTYDDLARLMHMINKELDIPGFGMDEQSETCFYRLMLPTLDNQIDRRILDSYLKSIQLICEQIAPTVIVVANGIATYKEILRKAQDGS